MTVQTATRIRRGRHRDEGRFMLTGASCLFWLGKTEAKEAEAMERIPRRPCIVGEIIVHRRECCRMSKVLGRTHRLIKALWRSD
jgi:hypothetical protein